MDEPGPSARGSIDLREHPSLELVAPCGNPVIGALSFRFLDPNATDSGVAAVTYDLGDGRRATLVMAITVEKSKQTR